MLWWMVCHCVLRAATISSVTEAKNFAAAADAVDIFNERGVEVIVGVQGEAQVAVETYLKGELISTGSICHQHEHAHECGGHN